MVEGPSADSPIRHGGAEPQSTEVFAREATSVADARVWLSAFLRDQHVPDGMSNDAVLVISELVTNALRHGLGEIVARSSLSSAGVLHLAVTDSGRELPELQPLDPRRVGGVGLQIVDQVAFRWGIAPFPGGKTVWATIVPHQAL